jgi:hypothetical protein
VRSGTCGRVYEMLICSGKPTLQRSVRQTERRIPAAAVAVEKGRAGSRAALQLWEYSTVHTGGTYRFLHMVYVSRSSRRQPPTNRARHGKERASRLRHMRDAWLLLRTIGRPGGCREHGTRASIWFSLPSSLGRAAPRPCSRWPSALEDPCRVWSWDELGGKLEEEGRAGGSRGWRVNMTGNMQRRFSVPESSSRYIIDTKWHARCETCQKRGWRRAPI